MADFEASYRWAAEAEQRFAERMKEVRETLGVSQAQLAKQMTEFGFKMHQSSIAKMESSTSGERRPIRLSEALAIAYVLGQDFDNMLYGPLGDAAPHIQQLEFDIQSLEMALTSNQKALARLRRERAEAMEKVNRRRGQTRRYPPLPLTLPEGAQEWQGDDPDPEKNLDRAEERS
jgi:transcriptional regulator with XRE-family HTH domain